MGTGWKRRFALLLCATLFALLYTRMRPMSEREKKECPKGYEKMLLLDSLYEGENLEFLSAGKCDHCHGMDDAGIASVDAEGQDVNLVDDWSSSMMANSARDPFWRAKVSHEVFVNPQLQSEIEGTCTKCHAPLGRYAGIMNGEPEYSMVQMLEDSVALDGVSCLACHKQNPQPEVALHTGQLSFSTSDVAFGPYESPLISPMAEYTGYVPEYATHISDSKLCASCHSLITETVDLDGNLTGDEFVEQATWHEWLNSSYPAQNTSCQSCHLPSLGEQSIKLAAGYDTPGRQNFSLHTLAGGNTLMLKLMRDNRESLGIFASEAQYNETINATMVNLQNNSLIMETNVIGRNADSIYVEVKLKNITGHKLPSGYPARRMSLHVVLTDNSGNEIFRSGSFGGDFAIPEEDSPYEPHYDRITSESQVQIYEMVMGDVAGNRSNVLTRGYSHLKDNRLVPLGFSTASNVYDTTEVVLGIPDLNFNFDPNEGSGTDVVHFAIPTEGYTGIANLNASVYYQSLPPVWVNSILEIDTPQINSFEAMFADADKSPVLMRSNTASIPAWLSVAENDKADFVRILRMIDGSLQINADKRSALSVYDLQGKLIVRQNIYPGRNAWEMHCSAGTYLFVFESNDGQTEVEKVVLR